MTNIESLFGGALALLAKAAGIWLVVWAIRSRAEVDIKLTTSEQVTRWVIVFLFLGVASQLSPKEQFYPRAGALVVGLGFLVWPNLAHYLVSPFRRNSAENNHIP